MTDLSGYAKKSSANGDTRSGLRLRSRIAVPGRAADADPPQHLTCGRFNGDAGAERLDQLDHQLAARGPVGVPVGGDHPLVDAPGGLDLDVLIDGEQGRESGGLLVGEQVGTGVQGSPAR